MLNAWSGSLAVRLVVLAVFFVLAASGCGGDDGSSPWCGLEPRERIDTSCRALHCVASVVIDYKRLEPRGYAVLPLEGRPVDAAEAKQRALDHVIYQRRAWPLPTLIDTNRSGDFWTVFMAYEDSLDEWISVVHEPTGHVLFAEKSLWAEIDLRGYDFDLPRGFTAERALGCAAPLEPLQRPKLIETGAPIGSAPASTANDAFELLKRLQFTRDFSGGRYRVFIISFAPAIGEFDSESADWYAWLQRVPTP